MFSSIEKYNRNLQDSFITKKLRFLIYASHNEKAAGLTFLSAIQGYLFRYGKR